jgi:hypothetical protein
LFIQKKLEEKSMPPTRKRDPDPVLTIDEKTYNPCARHLPGGDNCAHEIQKGRCECIKNNNDTKTCTGNTRSIGVDMVKVKKLLLERSNNLKALEQWERYRSTGQGMGHLSDKHLIGGSPSEI